LLVGSHPIEHGLIATSTKAGLIEKPVDAVRQKAPTPLPDRVLMDAELARNRFAGHAIRASEDDPAAL